MTSSFFSWAQIAGGLALFLMGVTATSDGFRSFMGRSARQRMAEVTDKKPMAFVFGLILSAVTQSSSVATSFAVGLVDVGMLSLSGSLVVMIGASVGGTFVTLLLGLPVVQLAPGFLAISHFFVDLLKGKGRNGALVIRGISLVLTGMFVIKTGVSPLMEDPGFAEMLLALSARPLIMGFVAVTAAAVLQSSAAVMALAIALVGSGSLPLEAVYPIVLGSHVGSSAMVLMASLSGKRNARLLGIGSALYKVIGIALVLPFSSFVPGFLSKLSFLSPEFRCVVLQFAVVWYNALVVLPFTSILDRFLRACFVSDSQPIEEPAYLDNKLVEFPALALPLLDKELTRLAGFLEMETKLLLFPGGSLEEIGKLREGTDELWDVIADYFESMEISPKDGKNEAYARVAYALGAIKGIKESINDWLYPLIVSEGKKKRFPSVSADMGYEYESVLFELLRSAMGSFALGDLGLAKDVDRWYERLKEIDELIRRDIFRRGDYGRKGGLELLARGTQLAKACMEMTRGEKMAFEMGRVSDGRGPDVEMVRDYDEQKPQ